MLAKRGTPEYVEFGMRMLRGKFSDTPALEQVWNKASEGREQSDEGYGSARKRFWRLIASDTGDDARLIREILADAGYALPTGNAVKMKLAWDTEMDPVRLAKLEKKRPEIAARLRASAESARKGRKPANLQEQQRKESIEHIIPRHPSEGTKLAEEAEQYPTRFLDPENLRFENLYENILMGNKPE